MDGNRTVSERLEEMFFEPCDGEITYTEVSNYGHRSLILTCACGKEIGSHLLKNASELSYWCDRVITWEMAMCPKRGACGGSRPS